MESIVRLSQRFLFLETAPNAAKGKNPRTILRSIIELSHQLGLMPIGEGAETSEQTEFLKENGCDYIQGFYYSRSVDEQTFSAMLDQQRENDEGFPADADEGIQKKEGRT